MLGCKWVLLCLESSGILYWFLLISGSIIIMKYSFSIGSRQPKAMRSEVAINVDVRHPLYLRFMFANFIHNFTRIKVDDIIISILTVWSDHFSHCLVSVVYGRRVWWRLVGNSCSSFFVHILQGIKSQMGTSWSKIPDSILLFLSLRLDLVPEVHDLLSFFLSFLIYLLWIVQQLLEIHTKLLFLFIKILFNVTYLHFEGVL